MKAMHQILFCLFLVMAFVYAIARPEDSTTVPKELISNGKYVGKFDNIDVDEILNSERLLTNYFKCMIGAGRCTVEGKEIKKILPDALATECQKCTEKQQEDIKKIVLFLTKNNPKLWEKLMNTYDPEKIYRQKYAEQAHKLGIEVN